MTQSLVLRDARILHVFERGFLKKLVVGVRVYHRAEDAVGSFKLTVSLAFAIKLATSREQARLCCTLQE